MATASLLLDIRQQGAEVFQEVASALDNFASTAQNEFVGLENISEGSAEAIRSIGTSLNQSLGGLGGTTTEITNEFVDLDRQISKSLQNVSRSAAATVASVSRIDEGIGQAVNEVSTEIQGTASTFETLDKSAERSLTNVRSNVRRLASVAVERLGDIIQDTAEGFLNLGTVITGPLQAGLFTAINIIAGRLNPAFQQLTTFLTSNHDDIVLFAGFLSAAATVVTTFLGALNPTITAIGVLSAGVVAVLVRFESFRDAVINAFTALLNFGGVIGNLIGSWANFIGLTDSASTNLEKLIKSSTDYHPVVQNQTALLEAQNNELQNTTTQATNAANTFKNVLAPAVAGNFAGSLLKAGTVLTTNFIPGFSLINAVAPGFAGILVERVVPAVAKFIGANDALAIGLKVLRSAALDVLVKALQRFVNVLQNAVINNINAFANSILRLIAVPLTKLVQFLREQLFTSLLRLEQIVGTTLIFAFRQLISLLDNTLIAYFRRFAEEVVRLGDIFRSGIIDAFERFRNVATTVGTAITDLVSRFQLFNRVGESVSRGMANLAQVLQETFARFGGFFTLLQQFFGIDVSTSVDELAAAFTNLQDNVVTTATEGVRNLRTEWASAGQEFQNVKQLVLDLVTPTEQLTRSNEAAAESARKQVDAANAQADALQRVIDAERERVRRSAANIVANAARLQAETASRERAAAEERARADSEAQEDRLNRARNVLEATTRARDDARRRELDAERERGRERERLAREETERLRTQERARAEAERNAKRVASERARAEREAAAVAKARADAEQRELRETNEVVQRLLQSYPLLAARARELGVSTERLTEILRGEIRTMRSLNQSLDDIGRVSERVFRSLPRFADDWQRLGYRMRQVETQTRRTSRAFTLLSQAFPLISLGVLVARLVQLGTSAIRAEFQISRLREQSGISATSLKLFADEARLLGFEVDDVSGFIETFVDRVDEALQETGEGFITFNRLGVALRDVGGNVRATEDILRDTITALGDLEDRTEAAAIATIAFSGDGFRLVSIFNRIGPQIGQINQEYEKQVFQVAALNRTWGIFIGQIQGRVAEAFIRLVPLIDTLLIGLIAIGNAMDRFLSFLANLPGVGQALTFLSRYAEGLNLIVRQQAGLPPITQEFEKQARALERQNAALEDNRDLTAEAFQSIINDINSRQRDLFDANTARVLQEEAAARGVTTPIRPGASAGARIIGPSTDPLNLIQGATPIDPILLDPTTNVPIVNINVNNIDPNTVADEVYKAIDREQQPGGVLQTTR